MTMMLDHNDLIWFLLPSERNSCGERTPNQSGLTGIQKVLDPKERAAKKNRERWSLTGSFLNVIAGVLRDWEIAIISVSLFCIGRGLHNFLWSPASSSSFAVLISHVIRAMNFWARKKVSKNNIVKQTQSRESSVTRNYRLITDAMLQQHVYGNKLLPLSVGICAKCSSCTWNNRYMIIKSCVYY